MEREVELENAFLKCSSVDDAEKLLEKCKSGDIMVSLHDANAVYIRVSASSSELIGYAESELVGNSGYDYFHPDDFQTILKSHAKVTIKPEVDEVEYRIRKSNGAYLEVRSLSKTLKDDKGIEMILAFTIKRV